MEIAVNLRKKFMGWVRDITDPGYYILASKTAPLSQEEAEFVEIYENTFTLHSLSILTTIPGTVYFYHYYKAVRRQPIDEKRVRWARRGIIVFSPLAIALVSTAWLYEKVSSFEPRLREIQDFYQSNKEQDINSISFAYKTVQSL